jgi:hypothetical protein
MNSRAKLFSLLLLFLLLAGIRAAGTGAWGADGVSASCMKCHFVATTASGKLAGDFSFLLGNAQ